MDDMNTENIVNNETTKTLKRGKLHQNLENADETVTSGFYIREKSNDSKSSDKQNDSTSENIPNETDPTHLTTNDNNPDTDLNEHLNSLESNKEDPHNNNTSKELVDTNNEVKVKHSELREESHDEDNIPPNEDEDEREGKVSEAYSKNSDNEIEGTVKDEAEENSLINLNSEISRVNNENDHVASTKNNGAITNDINDTNNDEITKSPLPAEKNTDSEDIENQEITDKSAENENSLEIVHEKSDEKLASNDSLEQTSKEPADTAQETETVNKAISEDGKKLTDEERTDSDNELERSEFTEEKDDEMSKKKDSITISDILDTPGFDEGDIDDDFDPSLLCPDISMDVDESPVITTTANSINDVAPSPYELMFSQIVDNLNTNDVAFDLTPEEAQMKKNLYATGNLIQFSKIHCTACNIHLGSALTGANNRFVHPLLKVLICKKCYHFYTSGEFEKDEDGSELYCRWCGQGGEVLCCSSCAYVFCKKCIKNNFGFKKFKAIRESDDWNCFACDPKQLSRLKVACAEFIEYYQSEIVRVQALPGDQTNLLRYDYSRCCGTLSGGKSSNNQSQQKLKRKRKNSSDDPDYHPKADEPSEPLRKKIITDLPTTSSINTPIVATTPFQPIHPYLPRLNPISQIRPLLPQPGPSQFGQVFRVGSTMFKARPIAPQGLALPRTTTGITQVKIVPSPTPRTNILKNSLTASPTTKPPTRTVISVGPSIQKALPNMKHKWFEDTVKSTAKVNSNLSFTLSQLNKKQAEARSVEALATVHNKLQEVLSSSINSLIQIRKNLRSDFITGIKSIRLPPKTAVAPVNTTKNSPIVVEDDVIIINPGTSEIFPKPPPLIPATTSIKKSKKLTNHGVGNNSGFLKVRSLSALQNVASECITIPDDPPSPQKPNDDVVKIEANEECSNDNNKENVVELLTTMSEKQSDPDDVEIVEVANNPDKSKSEINNKESLRSLRRKSKDNSTKSAKSNGLKESKSSTSFEHVRLSRKQSNIDVDSKKYQRRNTPKTNEEKAKLEREFNFEMIYNVNDKPNKEIQKMLNAVVLVKKSRVIDEIIRIQGMKKFK